MSETIATCAGCKALEQRSTRNLRRCAACVVSPGGLSLRQWSALVNDHLRSTNDVRQLEVRAEGSKVIVETTSAGSSWVSRAHLTRAEAYAFFLGFMRGRDPAFLF